MLKLTLSFVSALLLTLTFPPFGMAYLAWIGLVPLLVVIRRSSPVSAFAFAFLAGICFFPVVFAWIQVIPGFTPTDSILLGVYLAMYWGLFGLALSLISRRGYLSAVFLAPVLWVSLEYLRSHAGFLALPWALLGHSQYRLLPIIQLAAITGVYGLSFVIVLVNAFLSEVVLEVVASDGRSFARVVRRLTPYAVATLAVVTFSVVYGFLTLTAPPSADGLRVCVVQGNIPQVIKWQPQYRGMILEKYCRLTERAAQSDRPALIIWPESAVPGDFLQDSQLIDTVCHLAQTTGTPLLLGSAQRPKLGNRDWVITHHYNSVFLISSGGGIQSFYHKIYLLPFAEYLPYGERWPWPKRLAKHVGNFLPGQEYTIFELQGIKFGVVVCWESIFPDLVRQFVARGAEFIVNVTNEAWFGDSAAPYQFLMMNVFRAIENRVALARATNTGISCAIDPQGRIMDMVTVDGKRLFVEGFLTKTLPQGKSSSFYTRYGEVFAYGNIIISFLLLLLTLIKTRLS
jgi:apolipoprotein N-acyltransferase